MLSTGSYSSDFPSSPRDNFNNMGNKSGGNRFTLGNYNMDSCPMGDSNMYSSSSTNNQSQYDSMSHPPIRETGIIEKLLVSSYCLFKILSLLIHKKLYCNYNIFI